MLAKLPLAVAAIALLVGCTALPGGARIPAGTVPAGEVAFDGLLPASHATASERTTRYIFMVHGMGETGRDYWHSLSERLGDQGYRLDRGGPDEWVGTTLNRPLTVSTEATRCTDTAGPPCRFDRFGEFQRAKFSKGTQDVVLYAYYWHADLHLIQRPFMESDLEERRSVLNGYLKRNTIVLGFGDAAAYLGPAGQLVQEGLGVGLCAMLREAAGRPVQTEAGAVACDLAALTENDARGYGQAEFGFVTMSLGSRMLFDTLEAHADLQSPVLPVLARRTRYFYMLANQLPLLGLGDVVVEPVEASEGAAATSDTGGGVPEFLGPDCDRANGFLVFASCERGRAAATSDASGPPPITDTLDVVAFRDPEDLLGFAAGRGMTQPRPSLRFIEVWNRNAPVYLGLFADPRKTHAEELEHDRSARLILCGALADMNGRLTPRTCL